MGIKNKLNGLKEVWQFDNRWQLLINRLFFRHSRINIYEYRGLEILSDHSAGDANGAREILTSPMYSRYLENMKFSGPINVLDIGANNGGFSLMLKAQGLKVKKVVCVELNPNTFSRLRFNIERNLDCDLFCLNAAINGDGRDLTVRLETGSAGDSIYRESSTGKLYEINGITFDGIYESCFPDEVIDLCKIDVEGAEFEVFSGAQSNQIRNVKYLLIEIHHNDSYNRQTLIDKLIDAGFEERQGEDKTHPNSHYVHFFVNKEL